SQLLAEIKLALVLLDLDFCLPLYVFDDVCSRDFALESCKQESKSLSDIETLNDLVFIRDLEFHFRVRKIRKPTGIAHIHLEDRRNFIRDPVDQLSERVGCSNYSSYEIIDFIRIGRDFLCGFDLRNWIRRTLRDAVDDNSAKSLQCDLNSFSGKIDSFVNAGGNAN